MTEYIVMLTATWPEVAKEANIFLLAIEQIHKRLYKINQETIEPFDMQLTDFEVLSLLRRQEPPHELTPTEINKMMFFSSGGTTKVLRRLQAKKFIELRKNHNDARSTIVRLTDKGQDIVIQAMERVLKKENQFVANLNDKEKKILERLLFKLLENNDR